jgi:PhnB protein
MGFTLNEGNTVHINLGPDTRAETKKLFDALSKGGKVIMELQDMFWGSYYGRCTDKYRYNGCSTIIKSENDECNTKTKNSY